VVNDIRATAKKVLQDANATLGTLEATIAKSVEKTSEKGQGEIGSVTEKALTSLMEAQKKANETLIEVLSQCNMVLANIQKVNAEAAAQNSALLKQSSDSLLEQSRNILQEIRKTNRDTAELHRKQMEEWGRVQAEAGKYANDIKRASVLLGFELDPNGLALIWKEEAVLLISRLIEWGKIQPWTTRPASTYMQIMDSTSLYDFVTFTDALDISLKLLRIGTIGRRVNAVR
jgi:hypothetical protein